MGGAEHRQRPSSPTSRRVLGRGRSGVVHYGRDREGRELATKTFEAHGLTKLIQWVFLGAPNPYLWCKDAVACAALRRQILAELVPHWLGPRASVATAYGHHWNEELRTHELDTAFVAGRAPTLHHPRRMDAEEARDLVRNIMRPLQARLLESGFDGLVWQAGKGNPVALNNFLRLDEDNGAGHWAWIDLESGVPALFPLNPLALLLFYLPRAFRYRPMFDDVDTVRLRSHLYSPELCNNMAPVSHARLLNLVDELELHQRRWKSLGRYERAIGYRLARGELSEERAEWYRQHPLRWYAHEGWGALRKAPRKALRLLAKVVGCLTIIPYRRIARGLMRFLSSQRYRYALSRRQVSRRIQAWETRGQMNGRDARFLRSHLATEESSSYLCDFGVHLAIKPFVKATELWLFPMLFAMGFVSQGTLALVLLLGGPAARTLYTSGRLIQAMLRKRERPWAALVVGVFPVFGNFAYPFQIAWSSTEDGDDLARFILYDGFATMGAHLPIWGGQDTLTEHFLNRLPDAVIRLRGKPKKVASQEPTVEKVVPRRRRSRARRSAV